MGIFNRPEYKAYRELQQEVYTLKRVMKDEKISFDLRYEALKQYIKITNNGNTRKNKSY